ncbi:MAG: ribbon-helix-helix protein, CopG family [Peptococcaceae bacterium]|nr:ribbon-helix-helix protein, CopG family [Peptococcaceae bacterium]
MRETKVWSVSLPPLLARQAEELAQKEQRTKSEMVREALRQYINLRKYETVQMTASARAGELGIQDENDIERLIDQERH